MKESKELLGAPVIYVADSETSLADEDNKKLAQSDDLNVLRNVQVKTTLTGALRVNYDLKDRTPEFSTHKELLDYLADSHPIYIEKGKVQNKTIVVYFLNLKYDGSFLLNEMDFLNETYYETIRKTFTNANVKSKDILDHPDKFHPSMVKHAQIWMQMTPGQKIKEIRNSGTEPQIEVIKTGSKILSIKFKYKEHDFEIRDVLGIYTSSIRAIGATLSKNPNNGDLHKLDGDLDYDLIKNSKDDYNEKELGYFWRDIDVIGVLMAQHLGAKPVERYIKVNGEWIDLKKDIVANRRLQREYEFKKKDFERELNKLTLKDLKLTASGIAVDELQKTLALEINGEIDWVPNKWTISRDGKVQIKDKLPTYRKPLRKDYPKGKDGLAQYRHDKEEYEQSIENLKEKRQSFCDKVKVRSKEDVEHLTYALFGNGLFDDVEEYNKYKNAYFGGFTYVDYEFIGKRVEYGVVCDRNSMYPSVMKIPYYPDITSKTELNIEVAEIELDKLYDMFLETIKNPESYTDDSELHQTHRLYTVAYSSFKLKQQTELGFKATPTLPKILNKLSGEALMTDETSKEPIFKTGVESSDDIDGDGLMFMTLYDLLHFKLNYDIKDLKIVECVSMQSLPLNPFGFFVAYFGSLKVTSKIEGNPVLTMYAKLCLNSAYGKFGQRWNLEGVDYSIDEDRLSFTSVPVDKSEFFNNKGESTVHNVEIALTVTARARDNLFRTIYAVNKSDKLDFAYSDTDSVHIILRDDTLKDAMETQSFDERQELYKELFSEIGIQYDDAILGAWKVEDEFIRAKYLRAKAYCEVHPKDKDGKHKFVIKLAGVGGEGKDVVKERITGGSENPEDWNFDNFSLGDNLSRLPFMVAVQAKGGQLLHNGFKDISSKEINTTPYFENGQFKEYV